MTAEPTNWVDIVTEKEFQATIIEMARAYGWLVYSEVDIDHYVLKTQKGWPDLQLVKPPRIIYAELKKQNGRISKEQADVLAHLYLCAAANPYLLVKVWRPSDMDAIERLLRG